MEEHVYPGEFVILMAAMLLPAIILAAPPQLWFLRRRGVSASRAWLSLLPTAVLTVLITALLFILVPLPRSLGLQDLFLGPGWFPVLPLAFIVVTAVATVISLWVARRV
jgi:hypothetical protein